MNFVKYHSLGNDFVIVDSFQDLSGSVADICNRHTGVGADGVLVVERKHDVPEMYIFNADGTQAETCLNGLRCVVQYLYEHHQFPKQFRIKIGERLALYEVTGEKEVITQVGTTTSCGRQEIVMGEKSYHGHVVTIGNPHFIVFEETSAQWLREHGSFFERHSVFPKKTNVEFVWVNQGVYNMLIFERGCGMTQACSSAAAALTGLLAEQMRIARNQKICIRMPGGSVTTWVDEAGVALQASAHCVYAGKTVA